MIRLLLIGAGAVVEQHYCSPLPRLERSGAVRVLGVVDPREDRARRVAGRFAAARTFPDCAAALSGGSYDLAVVASPPGLHAEHACAALAHGCHVLCEKPMATSLAEARRMNEAAAKAGRVLGVAFPRRFHAGFADVTRLLADGELGEDLRFVYREGSTYNWAVATDASFRREESGGGALLDRGVHMLDQLNWLFGDPVVVERSFDDSLAGGVETNARLELAFPRARGVMQVSWEYPLNNGLRIRGSRGEVALNGADMLGYRRRVTDGWVRIPARTDWPADLSAKGASRIRPADGNACFRAELVAMLRCIAFGEPIPVTGVRAEAVQSAIAEAYERAEPLDCPWLPAAERAAARAGHWKAAPPR
ncbi:MAG: Gfo/Idh/MocA family oxidoreductase [Mycobacterium sp.]|nr:Gfo/Idh/MocA family oxidoreductase [Mycobacterium sp.]